MAVEAASLSRRITLLRTRIISQVPVTRHKHVDVFKRSIRHGDDVRCMFCKGGSVV